MQTFSSLSLSAVELVISRVSWVYPALIGDLFIDHGKNRQLQKLNYGEFKESNKGQSMIDFKTI